MVVVDTLRDQRTVSIGVRRPGPVTIAAGVRAPCKAGWTRSRHAHVSFGLTY
jgi:hypothetical protein